MSPYVHEKDCDHRDGRDGGGGVGDCRCRRVDAVKQLVDSVAELVCGCVDGDCRHGGAGGGHAGHDGDLGHPGGHDCRHSGGRPTRDPGTDSGTLGTPLTPDDVSTPRPPREWVGPRKDMHLPFLFMRAFPGDTGSRPTTQPFWESPDVYILGGVHPDDAPDRPPRLGETAVAGLDNTVYAHIWNLGNEKAREVVVEFYWCDPSLGFNRLSAQLIGTETAWLGSRHERDCHKIVKCPESWKARFLNGGHECLLVRVWDVAADPMTDPEWDASVNRHLGQRNIHVIQGGTPAPALKLDVGTLYGADATVSVARHAPTAMPWLQLHTGERGRFPGQAVGTGALVLGAPGTAGGTQPLTATGDDASVMFAAGDDPPQPGQAHVYRVTASQDGAVIGGYTVVRMG